MTWMHMPMCLVTKRDDMYLIRYIPLKEKKTHCYKHIFNKISKYPFISHTCIKSSKKYNYFWPYHSIIT